MKLKSIASISLLFAALPATAATTYTISAGHVDAPAFGYDSADGFEPHIHNEGGEDGAVVNGVRVEENSEYEPGDVTILVPLTTTTSYNSVAYVTLPETPTAGTPYVGVGLEELDPVDWDGNVTITLTGAAMPAGASFAMWTGGGASGAFALSSGNPLLELSLAPGSHTHFNWGFSHEGSYALEFTISGIHLSDGPQTASGTYNFEVIPEPSSALLGAVGALALLRRRRF
jgi:surface-anchored protein